MLKTKNTNYKPSNKQISSGDWIVTEYEKWLFQKRGIEDLEPYLSLAMVRYFNAFLKR